VVNRVEEEDVEIVRVEERKEARRGRWRENSTNDLKHVLCLNQLYYTTLHSTVNTVLHYCTALPCCITIQCSNILLTTFYDSVHYCTTLPCCI
jgi:hypothetical protein